MRVLIIHGSEIHLDRLYNGLQMLGAEITYTKTNIPLLKYDMVFVDHTANLEIPKLDTKYMFLFDCEDDPIHFKPGISYHSVKDRANAYVKMLYRTKDNTRKDSIKTMAFPITHYLQIKQLANENFNMIARDFNSTSFIGVPTFLGRYNPIPEINYSESFGAKALGWFDLDNPPHYMYNQRVDWLLSLRNNKINNIGGLVFCPGDNLSKEWQTKYFGDVSIFEYHRVDYNTLINTSLKYPVSLCPTGMERISFRTFDLMAIGSIILWTDVEDRRTLYMPKIYVKIPDGDSLGEIIKTISPELPELLKKSQRNREVFSKLTPETILQDFLNQLRN